MTDIDFSKIDVEALLYTGGDYYLYECYEDNKFVGKGKFEREDVFLIFIRKFATEEEIRKFKEKGVIVVTDGNIQRLFKKVGNP